MKPETIDKIHEYKHLFERARQLPVDIRQGKNILITMLGEKPASSIVMTSDFYARQGYKTSDFKNHVNLGIPLDFVPEEFIDNITGFLNHAGLSYHLDRQSRQVCRILFGKDNHPLNDLLKATYANDHKQIGLAFGFPVSALSNLEDESGALRFNNLMADHYTPETIPEGVLYLDFVPGYVGPKVIPEHLDYGENHFRIVKKIDEICSSGFHHNYVKTRTADIFARPLD